MSGIFESLGGYSLGNQPSQSAGSSGLFESLGGHTIPSQESEEDQSLAAQDRRNQELGRSDIGRFAARTAKDAALGLLDVADLPNYALRKGSKLLGGPDWGSLADRAEHAIDEATEGYTKPASQAEKIGSSALRSVSTLPGVGMAAKGVGLVAKGVKGQKAAKMLERYGQLNAQNIGSAAGAGAASQAVLNETENPWLALAAGLAGGVGGGLAGHTVGRPLRVNHKALEAFKEAGIPYGLVDVSKSKLLHQLKDKLPKTLGTQTLMDDYVASQLAAVDKGLGKLGSKGSGKPEGLAVKGAAKGLEDQKVKFSRRYGKNEENLKRIADDQVPLKNVREWLDSLHPDVLQDLQRRSSKTKTYLQEILAEGTEGVDYDRPLKEILAGSGQTQTATRSAPYLKRKLSQMGEDLKAADAYGNLKEGELKHLSGLLSRDVEAALSPQMKTLGNNAYQNWKNVGGLYSEFKNQDVPHLNRILNEALYDPKTKTYSAVGKEPEILKVLESDLQTRGMPRSLKHVFKNLPAAESQEIAHSLLHNLGLRQGEFVPHVMDTNFRKLSHPAKNLLLKALGKQERHKFQATLEAIHQAKEVMKQANHSQSGHHIGSYQTMEKYGQLAKDLLSNTKGGLYNALYEGAATIGRNAGARLITSPKVADVVAKYAGKGPKHFNLKRAMTQPILQSLLEEGLGGSHKRKPLKIEITEGTLTRAKGGRVMGPMLQQILDETAARGRGGDTELAEITPKTASILDDLIHHGHQQVNPRTGLREYDPCATHGRENCLECNRASNPLKKALNWVGRNTGLGECFNPPQEIQDADIERSVPGYQNLGYNDRQVGPNCHLFTAMDHARTSAIGGNLQGLPANQSYPMERYNRFTQEDLHNQRANYNQANYVQMTNTDPVSSFNFPFNWGSLTQARNDPPGTPGGGNIITNLDKEGFKTQGYHTIGFNSLPHRKNRFMIDKILESLENTLPEQQKGVTHYGKYYRHPDQPGGMHVTNIKRLHQYAVNPPPGRPIRTAEREGSLDFVDGNYGLLRGEYGADGNVYTNMYPRANGIPHFNIKASNPLSGIVSVPYRR